ncbi:type III-B CRISPR module RAMP protein Cmr4 [Bacillus sp. HMF5848]|uniref:type III-B CRISPR module RAMP protein Cmr4 n=1 Tax=Bacillus sp. HMF5848 TaxID=2495421 RepID=UPI000F7AA21C|nr:type III-B CRISPR module RAMP protein Cmr4 [Bacillus sp. HMF5848]RSK26557.1 type III-B CRISPR module RAMP protein Cmr4 [Bacillus sp. HMF5848]
MYTKVEPFLLYCLSSVHAGSGSEVGIIDLPIQREQHTGFPKIESSSLKGAIRATAEETNSLNGGDQNQLELVFGSAPEKSKESSQSQAGAIALSDARILLFPVKSIRGVFAWVTSPFVLNRFKKEMLMYLTKNSESYKQIEKLAIPNENTVSSSRLLASGNNIVLEEYTYEVQQETATSELASQLNSWLFRSMDMNLSENLVVLSDDDFTDFVKLSTEVNARIKINSNTGIVDKGALWYEENVPAETVFYSFLFAGNARVLDKEMKEQYSDEWVISYVKSEENIPEVFQLGGNSTLGRGMLRKVWI